MANFQKRFGDILSLLGVLISLSFDKNQFIHIFYKEIPSLLLIHHKETLELSSRKFSNQRGVYDGEFKLSDLSSLTLVLHNIIVFFMVITNHNRVINSPMPEFRGKISKLFDSHCILLMRFEVYNYIFTSFVNVVKSFLCIREEADLMPQTVCLIDQLSLELISFLAFFSANKIYLLDNYPLQFKIFCPIVGNESLGLWHNTVI